MVEGDTPTPHLPVDEWQDVAFDVFEDIWEQHGIGSAVTCFLTTLGMTAVESGTIGELINAMQSTVEVMLEQAASGGTATVQ